MFMFLVTISLNSSGEETLRKETLGPMHEHIVQYKLIEFTEHF